MNKAVVSLDRGQQFDVSGYYPTRLFWDMNDARLLVCEARRAQCETLQQQTALTDTEVFVVMSSLSSLWQCLSHRYLCV